MGNPDLNGWDIFPNLPGALEEAETVASLLRSGGFNVRDSLAETVDSILCGLHADAWRILHLAGHGAHDFVVPAAKAAPYDTCQQPRPVAERKISGMVIGDGVFLTPGEVGMSAVLVAIEAFLGWSYRDSFRGLLNPTATPGQ